MNTNYEGTSFIRDQLGKIPGDVTLDFEFGALGSTSTTFGTTFGHSLRRVKDYSPITIIRNCL